MVNNFEAKIKSPKGFEKIPADVELTTTFLIHTSDFSGACMPFDMSRKWAELVNQEFSSQYVEEGELGIAQTPYMKNLDREEVMAQNEAGFLKVPHQHYSGHRPPTIQAAERVPLKRIVGASPAKEHRR